MSEIKGQLLGIVLTISIFAIVFGVMTTMFFNVSRSIEDNAEEIAADGYTNHDVSEHMPSVVGLHY